MPDFTPLYSPFTPQFAAIFIPLILVIVLWTIVLKGYALWNAARAGQKKWFIALLVINTLGVLEAVYLLWFRPGAPLARNSSSPDTSAGASSPQT